MVARSLPTEHRDTGADLRAINVQASTRRRFHDDPRETAKELPTWAVIAVLSLAGTTVSLQQTMVVTAAA
jgi:hypothetical protein